PLRHQHPVAAAAVVALGYLVDLEAERAVERDGALVDRRRHTAHHASGVLAGDGEEALVEQPADAAATVTGGDADEVDVGLVRLRLGQEPGQEAAQRAPVLGHERRLGEVDEEEPRQHVDHLPTAPPLVDERRNPVVVGGHGVPHADLAGYGATTVTAREWVGSQRLSAPPR